MVTIIKLYCFELWTALKVPSFYNVISFIMLFNTKIPKNGFPQNSKPFLYVSNATNQNFHILSQNFP